MERLLHYKLAAEAVTREKERIGEGARKNEILVDLVVCGSELIISLMIGRDVTKTNFSSTIFVPCFLYPAFLSPLTLSTMLSYVFCTNVIGFTIKLRLVVCMQHDQRRCFQAIQHVQHDIENISLYHSSFRFVSHSHSTWYWNFHDTFVSFFLFHPLHG